MTGTRDLLRIATAGSVDDGKSTLVGRLLLDTDSVPDDVLAAAAAAAHRRGHDGPDLSLLTDGLRAEREQGITIDVAWRYFSTARRSFVLADTPGHTQYTRNTVTGMSTAQAAVVLVDATAGVKPQTRRHVAVAGLLRVPHLVLAVNKMDKAGFSEAAFADVSAELAAYAAAAGVPHTHAVPVSALLGDNVVVASPNLSWFDGPTLLGLLELVPTDDGAADRPARLAVALVVRGEGIRGYAGRVTSGSLRPGDEVVVLPSGHTSTVASLETFDGPLQVAGPGTSVVVTLTDDVDVSRGDILAAAGARASERQLDLTVAWLDERPLHSGARVLVRHATRTVRGIVAEVAELLDIETLEHASATTLSLNDVGRIVVRTAEPLAVEPYARDRSTGTVLLVDPDDGATLAAGMLEGS